MKDPRAHVARFYDLDPNPPNDVGFYRDFLTTETDVLELGCGTGRVFASLSKACRFIHGIELSESMLAICKQNLSNAGTSTNKYSLQQGDITDFALGRTFDLIIAPYRVLQNLETDAELSALFGCIRNHLTSTGSCILNVFNPKAPDREALVHRWCTQDEELDWETMKDGSRITCHSRKGKLDAANLVLYPQLIYRVWNANVMTEEVRFDLAMRCYFPHGFDRLIRDHEFEISRRWGGYAGEPYGEGPELVIQFRKKD